MSKKTKFQLGDHVTYSNKRLGYTYTGEIIARNGRYCLVEITQSTGKIGNAYVSQHYIDEFNEYIPEKFVARTSAQYWGDWYTRSNQTVWDSSQHLHHVMKPYDVGQNGDTDDDV